MKTRFVNYIKDNSLATSGDRIILAVSGGKDSMVMAHLFISAGFEVAIAHCNFKLRGKDSDLDEELVRNFSLENKVPFFSESFRTSGYALESGISIQMAARDLRYDWFEKLRISENYDYVAVAHNLNDNIETFLINLTRGTGIAGLTGMNPRNNRLIRPLLFATRGEIEAYQAENRIQYREDRTNAETKYIRNKIRHTILPLFREINPSFDNTILETAGRFRDIGDLVARYISDLSKMVTDQSQNYKTRIINIKKLQGFSPSGTVLFELFREYGIGSGQVKDLEKLIKAKSGAVLYTRSHRLLKNRNQILITAPESDTNRFYVSESVGELTDVPVIASAEIREVGPGFIIPSDPGTACLDFDSISFPVLIRKWEAGDSFYPLGMTHRKKISDYLIDRKFSIQDKEECYILESGGKIAWVIGERIDNRFRFTKTTRKVLIIIKKDD